MNMGEWLDYGIEKGFCSETCCNTHDGVEGTDEENAAWEAGEDHQKNKRNFTSMPDAGQADLATTRQGRLTWSCSS